ncbi:outer membrane lipid asymmetry maintenance protein MlaD [Sediminicurvatus halobius]|uniref:Outer membrane lipid asymmetry maintenance protein MlaD n=1 Tax=Sediminicurvatus halobius TaxID=2182432 RepID=A0A2U2N7X5_9GAMM|nr:outer membrane lipid asymmetry maintenance protein MlaD [Spiribacter halobius]PWG65198.1 outer membrane lipid asymmetry maintenance protein MlaD [Spiribacter halobius]UEX78848.1 outer membrane lipid asymmetry maintenance protein MlaD [Spiribacter halobius]
MGNSRTIEIAVGVFVVAGLAALFVLAMRVSNITAFQSTEGYTVVGYFQNVGGLRERAEVTLGGVQIGRVTAIALDQERLEARVEMTIDGRYDDLPSDTSASIRTSGLLGEQYVGLEPGGMPDALAEGDEIMLTQSALVLEDIIGQFLYNQASDSDN